MRRVLIAVCLWSSQASAAIIQFDHSQRAATIPYDGTTSGLTTATTVQQAIDLLYSTFAGLVSPGFTWGRSGAVTSGSYLMNDTVPCNITGRNFPFYNGQLVSAAVSNELVVTSNIAVYEHNKTTFTLLGTVNLVSQRSKEQNFTGVPLTKGKELCVQISSGSVKNIVVQLVVKGTLAP